MILRNKFIVGILEGEAVSIEITKENFAALNDDLSWLIISRDQMRQNE